MPDGLPGAASDAPLGGQAVLEGVMMRGVGTWAVAVRTDDGEVTVSSREFTSAARRHRILRLPVLRGVVALVESMRIGFRALAISAGAQAGGGDDGDQVEEGVGALAGAVVLAVAIGLFFIAPAGVALLAGIGSLWLFLLVETALRLAILVGYLASINRSASLRRTLAYHGAEHKAISCHEAGDRLTPERAERYSRLHPRCGTSFLLAVMILATAVYAPLGLLAAPWLLLSRMLGLPIAVGIAYEAIKWMGRHRGRAGVRSLVRPGLELQRLTTRSPDRDQLAVAIAALECVLNAERAAETRGDEVEIVA